MSSATPLTRTPSAPGSNLARSAGILGLGSVASRVLGLLRETTLSGYFGSTGELSAFKLASQVPTIIYDLVAGGMLSAALVPVFSDYARPSRRDELARVASAMLSLITVIMTAIVVLIELFARPVAGLLGNFSDPGLQEIVVRSLRIMAPAAVLFGLSGGITGLLYALRKFSYTAAAGAVFNLGLVIAVPLLAPRIWVTALPIGIFAGSVLQLVVMLPALRGIGLHLSVAWGHPGVRRIFRLYLPIAIGLVVSNCQIVVDRRWASETGAQSISWMSYATTLVQLPLGLVPVAVSLAALPTLAQRAGASDWDGFRVVLARGLRLVLLLLVPATVGLWVLAGPVVRLLFEHGSFVPADTPMTAGALRLYLLGLPFAGVDFLVNYSFYARQDTRTPALVGILAVVCYLVAAIVLKPVLGFRGLVLADSIKQAGHAIIMIILLQQSVGRLRGFEVQSTGIRAALAALVMAAVTWQLSLSLPAIFPAGTTGALALVIGAGSCGGLVYLVMLRALKVPEALDISNSVIGKLRAVRVRLASGSGGGSGNGMGGN